MTDDATIDWERITAYLAGIASAEEQASVEAWANKCSGNAATLVVAERIWNTAGQIDKNALDGVPETTTAMWSAVTHQMAQGMDRSSSRMRPRARGHFPWRIATGAALALGVAAFGLLALRERAPTSALRTYTTAAGQRTTLTMADGARVTLAPSTTLRVLRYDGEERMLALDGEAYFDVPHVGDAPFVVRTGAVSTRVLGTAFDVQHDAKKRHVRVVVTNGKVSVETGHRTRVPFTLTSAQVATISDSSATIATTDTPEHYSAWTDGQLMFRGAPAADVLAALQRWYGYQFRLADTTLNGRKLTIRLSADSLSAALATLELVLEVDRAFEGNTITLRPRRDRRDLPASIRDRRKALSISPTEMGR